MPEFSLVSGRFDLDLPRLQESGRVQGLFKSSPVAQLAAVSCWTQVRRNSRLGPSRGCAYCLKLVERGWLLGADWVHRHSAAPELQTIRRHLNFAEHTQVRSERAFALSGMWYSLLKNTS